MASGPTLPPQAYTREILTAAFNWLQSQPDSVRKLATTPDALVGLYMRAQRFGNSSLEADAPVSSQSFMSDLKNLAEGLKQFEGPQDLRADLRADLRELREVRHSRPQPAAPPLTQQSFAPPTPQQPQQQQPPPQAYAPAPVQTQQYQTQQYMTAPPANFPSREVALAAMGAILNERSLAMIQDVKAQLNLSSDAEAVNMMVSLAYKSLKNLIV